MSGTPEAIDAFTTPLLEKVRRGADADIAKLSEVKEAFLKEKGIEGDSKIRAWDSSFYSALLLKKEYGVDQDKIAEYFPLDHVVTVTMEIYQELMSVVFTEITSFDKWHPDVKLYKVDDKDSGNKIGFFYLDLHPRDGKYNHAAIFHLLKRWKEQGSVDCMMCNMPSASLDGKAALLRHGDVVTFFHE